MRHKCKDCEYGTFGPYVKICERTGEIIETYKEQYKRTVKQLKSNKNVVHIPGVHEH